MAHHRYLSTTVGFASTTTAGLATGLSRAALIWQATPKTTFKALYGRAHRSPNSYERDYNDGAFQVASPELHSEFIDTAELVADYLAQPSMNLRASVYAWDMYHLIALGIDPLSGLSQYQQNSRKVSARGTELSLDKTWAWVRGCVAVRLQSVDNKILISPHSPLSRLDSIFPADPLITGIGPVMNCNTT